MKRAVQSLVEPLSATWLDLADVHFEIASMQTSPMTFQLVPPSEPVLMLHLEARLDGLVSPIILCLPYRSVEQIVNKLEHRHYEGQQIDAADAGKVRRAISGVDVELRVEAGAVDMKVSEVLELNVGDVIRLKRPRRQGRGRLRGRRAHLRRHPGPQRQRARRAGPRRLGAGTMSVEFGPVHSLPPQELESGSLMDTTLRVWAEIGRTRMPAATVVGMAEGAILDLDSEPDAPADLFVNGRHLGTGRLILVDGEWALRVETLDDGRDAGRARGRRRTCVETRSRRAAPRRLTRP